MLSFLGPKPSLLVTVEQDLVFLHPNQNVYEPSEPTVDPELRGTAVLRLPKRADVKLVKVVFEGLCNAWGGNGYSYETSTTISKVLEIDLKGESLPAGDHAFNFSFIIPSNTAVYERSNYGRVRHYVKAFVDYSAGSSSSTSTINSTPVAIFLSAQSALNQGELPEPLQFTMNHQSEEIGPVRSFVSSPYFTPSCLVSIAINLPSPTAFTLLSINTVLCQQYTIIYSSSTSLNEVTPPELRYVLPVVGDGSGIETPEEKGSGLKVQGTSILDPVPLVEVQSGHAVSHRRIMRVPDDDHVRPTTLTGSEGRIRVSHQLLIEIRYRLQDSTQDKLLTMSKKVLVAGCCCLKDALYLPSYQKALPKTISRPVKFECPPCACRMTVKDMFDRDGLSLARALDFPMGVAENLGSERVMENDKTPSAQWVLESEGRGSGESA